MTETTDEQPGDETGDGDATAATNETEPDAPEPGRAFFAAVAPCAVVFVVTVLAMIAAAFGEPGSPTAAFFDRHGTTIIVWEAGVTIGVTLLAMVVDRWLTLRAARETEQQ